MRRSRAGTIAGLVGGCAALAVVLVLSIAVGARDIPFGEALRVAFQPDGTEASLIVHDLRIPRTVIGLVAGAALAVAGAVMQALTRNPLADPGLLGVNAGAGLAITVAVAAFGATTMVAFAGAAFVGALLGTLLVLGIAAAGHDRDKAARLVLAGLALAAIFGGISMAVAMMLPRVFVSYRAWTVGSLAGRDLGGAVPLLVVAVLALAGGLLLARGLGTLALGDDHARALGTPVRFVRLSSLLVVTMLAATATALMGPVAFIGLLVAHAVRLFTGPSQPWIIAACLVYGPLILLGADVAGRVVARPGELPVSLMTALLGAPVLIALITRRRPVAS